MGPRKLTGTFPTPGAPTPPTIFAEAVVLHPFPASVGPAADSSATGIVPQKVPVSGLEKSFLLRPRSSRITPKLLEYIQAAPCPFAPLRTSKQDWGGPRVTG